MPSNCKIKAARFSDFKIHINQVKYYLEVSLLPVLGTVAFFVLRIQPLEFSNFALRDTKTA